MTENVLPYINVSEQKKKWSCSAVKTNLVKFFDKVKKTRLPKSKKALKKEQVKRIKVSSPWNIIHNIYFIY